MLVVEVNIVDVNETKCCNAIVSAQKRFKRKTV
jgi:hypothetical protein